MNTARSLHTNSDTLPVGVLKQLQSRSSNIDGNTLANLTLVSAYISIHANNYEYAITHLFRGVCCPVGAKAFLSSDVLAEHSLVGYDLVHHPYSLPAVWIIFVVFSQVEINLIVQKKIRKRIFFI